MGSTVEEFLIKAKQSLNGMENYNWILNQAMRFKRSDLKKYSLCWFYIRILNKQVNQVVINILW